MKKLIKGIIDFRHKSLLSYREKFGELAHRHTPDALFIACCDSRVVPNTFASTDPGDLFVLRNIGNLVPPYVINKEKNFLGDLSVAATIEFSLLELNVTDIIVCGHSECAAMITLMNHQKNNDLNLLNHWLDNALPSYQRFETATDKNSSLSPHNQLSQINVIQQLEHLKTYPMIQERLRKNKLHLHGWWFDLASADVHYFQEALNQFTLMDEHSAKELLKTL